MAIDYYFEVIIFYFHCKITFFRTTLEICFHDWNIPRKASFCNNKK